MNDWRPDWKDSAKYPCVDNTTMIRWAWEFMRRCPDYERDQKIITEIQRSVDRENQEKYKEDSKIFGNLSERYGCNFISGAPLASSENPPVYDVFCNSRLCGMNDEGTKPEHMYQVAMRFDLTLPIEIQLDFARNNLLSLQDNSEFQIQYGIKKLSPNKYQTYLRLLDADHQKATQKAIVRHIFNHDGHITSTQSQAVARNRKSAEFMHNLGFRQLPYLTTKRPRKKKKDENLRQELNRLNQ